ncbi:MAG TPA: hypothetical protein GX398_07010 [Candidatus Cloacimonetes bacterium]|nr:hypothetical protein [Candidatus Cloacimonadota bacterium]
MDKDVNNQGCFEDKVVNNQGCFEDKDVNNQSCFEDEVGRLGQATIHGRSSDRPYIREHP